MTRAGWWLGFAILLLTSPTDGQTTANYGVSTFVGTARREDNRSGTKVARNGVAVGFEAHYALRRVVFDLRYLQGALPDSQDIIEGELFVGVRIVPWLRVKVGRHIRSVVMDDITERWSMWEGRLRAEGEVFAPSSQTYGVHAYAESWLALAGSANVTGDFGAGRGVEGGVFLRLSGSPLTGRLGYRVDRATISNSPRLENIQELTISFGWGR